MEKRKRSTLSLRFIEERNFNNWRWWLRSVPAVLCDIAFARDPLTMMKKGSRVALDWVGTSSRIESPAMTALKNENKGRISI